QDKVKVVRLGVADEIVTHGDPKVLLAQYSLDVDGITETVKNAVKSLREVAEGKRRLRAVK
ncbi:MAG: hypothetical protein H0U23_14670, partial [Blastocatellia bacterium]|nr:hypothetical protein [Blastocatellia bacterium]